MRGWELKNMAAGETFCRHLCKYKPPDWAAWLCKSPKYYVPLAQRPTPIHVWSLPRVPSGFQVCIKRDDLTGAALSGNKVRKLEFLLGEAIESGCDTVLTCGTLQSNFCRAAAIASREVGLKSYLFVKMRDKVDTAKVGCAGNLLLDRLCGSTLVAIPNIRYKGMEENGIYTEGIEDKMKALAEKLRMAGHKPYLIPTGGSNVTGAWGYIEGFREMLDQGVTDHFDDIVTTVGSGGTAEGLAIANHLSNSGLKIHAMSVSDSSDYFYNHIDNTLQQLGLLKDNGDPLKATDILEVVDGYKGRGYGLSTAEELSLLTDVASTTGILLDPVYTVKAVRGMLEEMAHRPERFKGRRVLFMHTGGIFGSFAGGLDDHVLTSKATNQVYTLDELLSDVDGK